MKDKKRGFAKMGIIALTAIIGISIVSCAILETMALMSEVMSAEDEGLSEEQRLLVGAWRSDTGHLYTFNEDRTGTIRQSGSNSDQNMRWTTFGNILTITIVDSESRMDATYILDGDELSWVQIGTNDRQIRTTRDIPGLAFTHTGANNCVVSIGTEIATEIVIPAACPQGHNVTGIAAAVWSDSASSYVGSFTGTSITSIVIPGNVTSIGDCSFYDSNVTTVTIGNGVTSIGEGAFQWCYNLSSIIIPDSVTSIGRSAFSRCGLSTITIGRGVTSIGQAALSNNSLDRVTFLGTIPASGFDTNAMGWNGAEGYMGDLRAKYLAGGPGTYTRSGEVWTRQR